MTIFQKLKPKGQWHQDDLWPTSVEVTCVTFPKDHYIQVPWNTSQHVDTVLNQRSLTSRWPLTQSLLRSHVWLYLRIIVSKCHENASKYVNTVALFSKTWTRGHWPLDDLWLHICWGHMCDSTQGSLCPKFHGNISIWCMWIQWSILQILTKITTYYILYTSYIDSCSLNGQNYIMWHWIIWPIIHHYTFWWVRGTIILPRSNDSTPILCNSSCQSLRIHILQEGTAKVF